MNLWIFVPLLIIILIDVYAYQTIKLVFDISSKWHFIRYLYWVLNAATYLTFLGYILLGRENVPVYLRLPLQGLGISWLAFKFVLVIFLLLGDVFRILQWLMSLFMPHQENNDISRKVFLHKAALFVGSFWLGGMIYGMVRGAYNYTIKTIKVKIHNLHPDLKGLRIIQISDIHLGSFINTKPIEEVVKIINGMNADIIFFTGDMVNEQAKEASAFVPILSTLRAKYGIFSILGNHDYGDYIEWESQKQKVDNFKQLLSLHQMMGWDLLLDEHRILKFGNATLGIVGVQYWGKSLSFGKFGNLQKAIEEMPHTDATILLSHDPSHWDAEVSIEEKYRFIDLTLSGHTHGFQMGIEVPGWIKWSPSKLIYPHWAGLYSSGNQHLYVNRGLGFIGYPGRWGMPPEITLLELA